MANKKAINIVESETIKSAQVEKSPKWKSKKCRVVNYIPSHGILGFDFDGVGCQINVQKNMNIGSTVKIQYLGELGKDIKFKI